MIGGSLFTGIAGLDIGLELAGAVTSWAWQCEKDPHALAVLAHHYQTVRRYTDVREVNEHAARPDIICGGFPCQDISDAGNRVGIDGDRSGLWREFARIVRVLRPGIVFVENVRPLIVRGLDRVLGDLAALGYDAVWETFRAADVGAPHLRERIFILAYSDSAGREGQIRRQSSGARRGHAALSNREAVSDTDGSARIFGTALAAGNGSASSSKRSGMPEFAGCDPVAYADGGRREGEWVAQPGGFESASGRLPDGRGHERYVHRFPPGPDRIAEWDGPQPAVRRGDDGVPGRSHRLRLLGNAVVPQQAALAWRTLIARAAETSGRAA